MSADVRAYAAKKISGFFSWIVITFVLIGLFPLTVNAGAVVIFFSGLCVGGSRQVTCSAGRNAHNAIKPLLPAGADVYSPTLYNGKFTNNGEQQAVLQAIKSNKAVLVAFSAGHQALWQTLSALGAEDLKRVHSIVNLEANYGGWYSSVSRVRRLNPATEVHSFTSGSCGTNHDNMPGNPCIAGKIATLAKAAHDGTPSSIPQKAPPDPATPPPATASNPAGPPPSSPIGAPMTSGQPYSGYSPLSTGYSAPTGQAYPSAGMSQPYQNPALKQPLEIGSYVPLPSSASTSKSSDSISFFSLTTGQSAVIATPASLSGDTTASSSQNGTASTTKSATTSPSRGTTTFDAKPGGGAYYFPEPPRPQFDLAAALASIITQVQAILAAIFGGLEETATSTSAY